MPLKLFKGEQDAVKLSEEVVKRLDGFVDEVAVKSDGRVVSRLKFTNSYSSFDSVYIVGADLRPNDKIQAIIVRVSP